MKRKSIKIIVVTIISMGLIACGKNSSDIADAAEAIQELSTFENLSEDIQKEELSEKDNAEAKMDDTEIVEQEDNTPIWYLDSEGIKNDELGLIIRKDNAEFDELSLRVNFSISGSQQVFACGYCEDDLDTYISEHYSIIMMRIQEELLKAAAWKRVR